MISKEYPEISFRKPCGQIRGTTFDFMPATEKWPINPETYQELTLTATTGARPSWQSTKVLKCYRFPH
jgi:hypothetical protein